MRPRVFPAEDLEALEAQRRREEASMRPRVFPAEDLLREWGVRPNIALLQ